MCLTTSMLSQTFQNPVLNVVSKSQPLTSQNFWRIGCFQRALEYRRWGSVLFYGFESFLKKRRWRESLKFLKRGSYWIAFKVKWKNPDSRSPIQFDLKIRGNMWAGFILLAITLGSYFLNCFKVINRIRRVEHQSNHTQDLHSLLFLYTLSFVVLFAKSHH